MSLSNTFINTNSFLSTCNFETLSLGSVLAPSFNTINSTITLSLPLVSIYISTSSDPITVTLPTPSTNALINIRRIATGLITVANNSGIYPISGNYIPFGTVSNNVSSQYLYISPFWYQLYSV